MSKKSLLRDSHFYLLVYEPGFGEKYSQTAVIEPGQERYSPHLSLFISARITPLSRINMCSSHFSQIFCNTKSRDTRDTRETYTLTNSKKERKGIKKRDTETARRNQ
jgi:hypothetical protein